MTLPITVTPTEPVASFGSQIPQSGTVLSFPEMLGAIFQQSVGEVPTDECDLGGDDCPRAAEEAAETPQPDSDGDDAISEFAGMPPSENPPFISAVAPELLPPSPEPRPWATDPPARVEEEVAVTPPTTVAVEMVVSDRVVSDPSAPTRVPEETVEPSISGTKSRVEPLSSQVAESRSVEESGAVPEPSRGPVTDPVSEERGAPDSDRFWQQSDGATGRTDGTGAPMRPGSGPQSLSTQTVERITQWLEQVELGRSDSRLSVELADPDGDFLVRLAMRHGRLEMMVTREGGEVPLQLLRDLDDALTRHGFDVASEEQGRDDTNHRRRRSRGGDPDFENELEARRRE